MVAEDLEEEDSSTHQDLDLNSATRDQEDARHEHFDLNSSSGPISWLRGLQDGGPIKMLSDVENDSVAGWSSPPGDFFQVRGEDYLTTKLKIPGGDTLLQPLAFDWMKSSSGKIDEVLRHPQNRIARAVKNNYSTSLVKEPFIWAFNLQVPSNEHYSLIAYYISTAPICEGSLMDRFIKGDNEFRNSRLKLIASIVSGPWVVKSAVGEHAVCLLGKSLTCRYVQGDNFLEVDVDIGSSIVASAIVHLAINYVTSLTVDLAFLIEGRSKDELPEKVLATIRFSRLELDAATPMEALANSNVNMTTDPSKTKVGPPVCKTKGDEGQQLGAIQPPIKSEEKNVEESFQSHFWKSFSHGLSLDWWGRQEL